MRMFFKGFFQAPNVATDGEKAYRAGLLHVISLAVLTFSVVAFPVLFFTGDRRGIFFIVDVLFCILGLGIRYLLYRGETTSASVFLIAVSLLLFTATVAALGSIRSPSTSLFFLVVLFGGLLFRFRGVVTTVMISSCALLSVAWMETSGLLQQPDLQVGVLQWAMLSAMLVVVSSVAFFSQQTLHKAFRTLSLESEKRKNLLERAQMLSQMVDIAPNSIIVHDASGQMLYANQKTFDMHGYSREEFMVLNLHQLDVPESEEKIAQRMDTIRREGEASFEVLHFRKDGTRFPLQLFVKQATWEGKPALLSIGTDTSERVNAREDLMAKNSFITSLLEATPIPIFFKDKQGRYMGCNRAFTEIMGVSSAELEGKTAHQLWPGEIADVYDQENLELLASEVHQEYEFVVRDKDGQSREVIFAKDVFRDAKGNVDGLVGAFLDISQRKRVERELQQSEKKFHTLFDAMMEMVVLHELVFDDGGNPVDYRIVDANPAFTGITGILREESIGKLASEVYQLSPPPYFDQYVQVASSGEPLELTEYFEPLDKHFMISVVSPRKNQFATITSDISPLHQFQQMLQEKNKELENYLYVASHDLRSPLVNIQGFSQRLQKQTSSISEEMEECELPPETRQKISDVLEKQIPRTLDFIFTNVSKMDALIKGLLQISRTGRGKMAICKVDMDELLGRVLQSFSFELEQLEAKVEVQPLPPCYGDQALLNQLFSNLVSNAIKYRDPPRRLELWVYGEKIYNKVIYRVQDNGIGINPRHLEKIWDVFFRVDAHSPQAGEGIGLSIVNRIVSKHKGRISVRSQEGLGTTFSIELPAVPFEE